MPSCVWMWLGVCMALVDLCQAHSQFTCESVRVQWCHGMPYNMTFFPNMLEHYDQDIAVRKMQVRSSPLLRDLYHHAAETWRTLFK